MNIDFGQVDKYIADRGFGFVTRIFCNVQENVFFHIKTIKKTHGELSTKLDSENYEKTYFWYEIESSKKGRQVSTVLNPQSVHEKYADDIPAFVEKIEYIWKNINSKLPDWLSQVTLDLVGTNRANQLNEERNRLVLQREEANEKKRKEQEELQRAENAKREKLIGERRLQEELEENEFNQLVAEMSRLRFTHSNQVSSYIMAHRLGNKYKNISGIVKMAQDGNTWNFNGGFPPHIYARLCSALDLNNQGTSARAVGFKSFKELNKD